VAGGGSGTFSPSANTPNATFTHTGGTGPIMVRWTVSNAPAPVFNFAGVPIWCTVDLLTRFTAACPSHLIVSGPILMDLV